MHALDVTHCPQTHDQIEPVHRMSGKVVSGKYEVGRFLAEGGMGVVYEGLNRDIGRKVAIKFLPSRATANPMIVRRFQNEARIAASVGSRNIVDVLDMGQTRAGTHYIVMELLEGTDLADFLDEAVRLPYPWAVDIAIQILEALRQVHERGVIHRDLKPGNVILLHEADGSMTVKIVDFGISCLARSSEASSIKGAVFGTPRYMSPEQARGKTDIDHRADLYSLGVMLYRMVSGSYPFENEDQGELINMVAYSSPLHISKHGIPLPAGLEAVVMWSIGASREERFLDAEEFIEALQPYRDAASMESLRSVPPGVADTPSKAPRPITLEEPSEVRFGRDQDSTPTIRPEDGLRPATHDGSLTLDPPEGTQWEGPAAFRIRLEDIPASSSVLVDGVLHDERPVLLPSPPDEHSFEVHFPDGRVWKRTVHVDADVVFFLDP